MKTDSKTDSNNNIRTPFMDVKNSYTNSDVVIIPIPYENTVSWIKGTEKGPKTIIEASMELEFFSTYLNRRIVDYVKIYTSHGLDMERKSYEDMLDIVEKKTNKILEDGKKIVAIGGEHSISIGIVNSITKRYGKNGFSVIQFDAHADMREEYLGSKFNHACTMKRIRENTDSTFSIGVRSYSEEENKEIKQNKIKLYNSDISNSEINEIIKNSKNDIYITIDLDVFDPSEVPAVGTPQPDGMNWKKILYTLRKISSNKNIIGFDIVELSPFKKDKRSDFLAAKLLYVLIGYAFIKK